MTATTVFSPIEKFIIEAIRHSRKKTPGGGRPGGADLKKVSGLTSGVYSAEAYVSALRSLITRKYVVLVGKMNNEPYNIELNKLPENFGFDRRFVQASSGKHWFGNMQIFITADGLSPKIEEAVATGDELAEMKRKRFKKAGVELLQQMST